MGGWVCDGVCRGPGPCPRRAAGSCMSACMSGIRQVSPLTPDMGTADTMWGSLLLASVSPHWGDQSEPQPPAEGSSWPGRSRCWLLGRVPWTAGRALSRHCSVNCGSPQSGEFDPGESGPVVRGSFLSAFSWEPHTPAPAVSASRSPPRAAPNTLSTLCYILRPQQTADPQLLWE